jgi:hypothetical protein
MQSDKLAHALLNTLPAALALAVAAAPGLAHACAACESTLSRDWETQGISGNQGFIADLSYNYLNQNRQHYGTGAASPALIDRQLNAGQEVEDYTRTQTLTASLMYNDDTWGASVHIPYLKRTHGTFGNTAPLGSSYSSSSDSGIGDVRVTGKYTGWSEDRSSGAIFGVKLPTGNNHANFSTGTAAGTPLDASLQIGTGSTDIILGGYTTGAFGHHIWFVQGTLQRAVAIQNNYRPGDTITLNTGIRYGGFGARVSPMLQLNIVNRQLDSGANATPPDAVTGGASTGGTLVYLAPGASIQAGGGATLYGFVQLPVYQRVNSLQLVPKYMATLGARMAF